MKSESEEGAGYTREKAYASIGKFLEAYNQGDAAGCASRYTDDATILAGDHPVASGREEVERLFVQVFEHGVRPMALFPVEVGSSGDLAFEIGTATVEIPQPDGAVMADERRYLTVLKRQPDGSWLMRASAWRGERAGPA